MKDTIKAMIKDLVKGNEESAMEHLHTALKEKMAVVAGFKQAEQVEEECDTITEGRKGLERDDPKEQAKELEILESGADFIKGK